MLLLCHVMLCLNIACIFSSFKYIEIICIIHYTNLNNNNMYMTHDMRYRWIISSLLPDSDCLGSTCKVNSAQVQDRLRREAGVASSALGCCEEPAETKPRRVKFW